MRADAAIAFRILDAALSRLRGGVVELVLPDGRQRLYGSGDGDPIVLEILSERFFRRLARAGKIGLGEAYTAGEWRTNDLVGLFELVARSSATVMEQPPLSWLARASGALPRPGLPATLARAERDIHRHYDLGNEFYRLFLDPSMTYSCALFEHAGVTLAEAQQAKYRRLCDRLNLQPGERVLEIGCGWGGFAIYAAAERGVHVTGTTISREQHELACVRVAEAGLADRVDVLYRDYRQLTGQFDVVVSIEMIEAIGHRQFGTFFATIERLLAADGAAAVQAILIPDQRYAGYRRRPDWIRKHIFPGGLLPSLTELAKAMTSSSRLILHELTEIGPHYATTLEHWRSAFAGRREDVLALGFDEPFLRTWEYYFAFCEAAFRTRALRDVQMVLTRPLSSRLGEPAGLAAVA